MNQRIQEATDALSHFLFPAVCQVCEAERAGPRDGFVCSDCREDMRFVEPPFCGRCGLPFDGDFSGEFECSNCKEMELKFDFARSAVRANGPIRDIIHRYKYNQQTWFEAFLGGLLLDAIDGSLNGMAWDAFLPVPLYHAREREREFNQAEKLSRWIGRRLDKPTHSDWIKRSRPTKTQTSLSRKERMDNVRKAFALKKPGLVAGKSFIIIDDVLTTGATTSACAGILKQAGAARVGVWTVARATFGPPLA